MNTFDVIKRPLITEKSTQLAAALNQYSFEVDPRATKHDVRNAVENIFKVTVTGVRTTTVPARRKRIGRSIGMVGAWKKAIVTLKAGDKISIVEAV